MIKECVTETTISSSVIYALVVSHITLGERIFTKIKNKNVKRKKLRTLKLCLVTVYFFYFQKLVFRNIKKKQFSCIFEIKNMFG